MQSQSKLNLPLFIYCKFIVKHRKIMPKWIQKSEFPQRARLTMKKKNTGDGLTLQNIDILHSHNNKISMVLAQEQRTRNRTGLFINDDLKYD